MAFRKEREIQIFICLWRKALKISLPEKKSTVKRVLLDLFFLASECDPTVLAQISSELSLCVADC